MSYSYRMPPEDIEIVWLRIKPCGAYWYKGQPTRSSGALHEQLIVGSITWTTKTNWNHSIITPEDNRFHWNFDKECFEQISERQVKAYASKNKTIGWRYKTIQEFKACGQWNYSEEKPNLWNVRMVPLYCGKPIPEKHWSSCEEGKNFSTDADWTIRYCDYVRIESKCHVNPSKISKLVEPQKPLR